MNLGTNFGGMKTSFASPRTATVSSTGKPRNPYSFRAGTEPDNTNQSGDQWYNGYDGTSRVSGSVEGGQQDSGNVGPGAYYGDSTHSSMAGGGQPSPWTGPRPGNQQQYDPYQGQGSPQSAPTSLATRINEPAIPGMSGMSNAFQRGSPAQPQGQQSYDPWGGASPSMSPPPQNGGASPVAPSAMPTNGGTLPAIQSDSNQPQGMFDDPNYGAPEAQPNIASGGPYYNPMAMPNQQPQGGTQPIGQQQSPWTPPAVQNTSTPFGGVGGDIMPQQATPFPQGINPVIGSKPRPSSPVVYGDPSTWRRSDIRLKSNIQRVGTHPLGVGVYDYDIDGRRERGVMAQELMHVLPSAVSVGDDGYFRVDYSRL